jgi:hypothetical protein
MYSSNIKPDAECEVLVMGGGPARLLRKLEKRQRAGAI